jgi:hypothetical protein
LPFTYYPPYHSKYNPVERTHGALEQYWNGMLLTDAETTVKIAQNMTWKGKHPFVSLVTRAYETGVKLTKKAMAVYEKAINRMPGLEDYFVDMFPSTASLRMCISCHSPYWVRHGSRSRYGRCP